MGGNVEIGFLSQFSNNDAKSPQHKPRSGGRTDYQGYRGDDLVEQGYRYRSWYPA